MSRFAKKLKTNIKDENSEISFCISPKIYPKDIIFTACYVFIDKVYVFLDHPGKDEIVVYLKSKQKLTLKKLEKLRDEFLNELLNASVRKNISKRNQKIVEHIVGGAVNAALAKPSAPPVNEQKQDDDEEMQEIAREIEALKKELELENNSAGDFEEDPLNIKKTM